MPKFNSAPAPRLANVSPFVLGILRNLNFSFESVREFVERYGETPDTKKILTAACEAGLTPYDVLMLADRLEEVLGSGRKLVHGEFEVIKGPTGPEGSWLHVKTKKTTVTLHSTQSGKVTPAFKKTEHGS